MSRKVKLILILFIVGSILGILRLVFFIIDYDESKFDLASIRMETKDIDDFNAISSSMNITHLKIVQGDGETSTITYPTIDEGAYKININVDDKILNVEEYNESNFTDFNPPIYNVKDERILTVTITLAESVDLEEVDLDMDVGEIHLQNVNVKGGSIESSVGLIHLDGCHLENTEVMSEVGEILLEETSLKDVRMSSDVGTIKGSIILESSSSFESAVGEVDLRIDSEDPINLEVATELGEVRINGEKEKSIVERFHEEADTTLKIKSEVGDVKLQISE